MLKKIVHRHGAAHSGQHGLSMSGSKSVETRVSSTAATSTRVSLLGAIVLLGPLTLLGEWLIDNTHHRPLGAATFASCTILLWMAFELGTRILFAQREVRPDAVRRAKRVLVALGGLSSFAVFARALL